LIFLALNHACFKTEQKLLSLLGVLMSNLRNIERISEETNVDYFQMQHFITESKWDHRELIDQVAREVSGLLPKRKLTGLIIDESGWVKKGERALALAGSIAAMWARYPTVKWLFLQP
jgi:hypothetical protein